MGKKSVDEKSIRSEAVLPLFFERTFITDRANPFSHETKNCSIFYRKAITFKDFFLQMQQLPQGLLI